MIRGEARKAIEAIRINNKRHVTLKQRRHDRDSCAAYTHARANKHCAALGSKRTYEIVRSQGEAAISISRKGNYRNLCHMSLANAGNGGRNRQRHIARPSSCCRACGHYGGPGEARGPADHKHRSAAKLVYRNRRGHNNLCIVAQIRPPCDWIGLTNKACSLLRERGYHN